MGQTVGGNSGMYELFKRVDMVESQLGGLWIKLLY